MSRLLLRGCFLRVGKKDMFMFWELQLENARCGSVKKKIIKVSMEKRLKYGIAQNEGRDSMRC